MSTTSRLALILGTVPFVAVLIAWLVISEGGFVPAYYLPPPGSTADYVLTAALDGTLAANILASLLRLIGGFLIGNAIAIPLGILIAMSAQVSQTLRPTLSFLQAIAGVAWIPLAIIWFGIGNGAVVFVIANTIFFSTIYSVVLGVESIPPVLLRASRSLGASRLQLLSSVIIPGALVQTIVGLRTSMAYGWRALVAGEMIAGTNGLGYMIIDAVQWYRTEVVITGMLIIGCLWLVADRYLFVPLERRTIITWGLSRA